MDIEVDGHGIFEHNTTYDYDESYEYKEDSELSASSAAWILYLVLCLVLLVPGLLGNGLLLTVLSRKWRSWSITDIFVLHLCIADVLLLLTLPLLAAQAFQRCAWCFKFGLIPCKIGRVLFYVSLWWQRTLVRRGRYTFALLSIPRNCKVSGKRRKQK